MTTTLAAPTRRAFTGVTMKLVSLDTQFDGTIVEILEYRPAAAGRTELVAIIDAPGAWYSGTHPVVLDASHARLFLGVQSFPRPHIHDSRKGHR